MHFIIVDAIFSVFLLFYLPIQRCRIGYYRTNPLPDYFCPAISAAASKGWLVVI